MIHITDLQREKRIRELLIQLEGLPRSEALRIWEKVKQEINSRSPDQVERMEQQAGLR